jgi:hypothetical protein
VCKGEEAETGDITNLVSHGDKSGNLIQVPKQSKLSKKVSQEYSKEGLVSLFGAKGEEGEPGEQFVPRERLEELRGADDAHQGREQSHGTLPGQDHRRGEVRLGDDVCVVQERLVRSAGGHGEYDDEVDDKGRHHGPQRPLGYRLAGVPQVPRHGRAGEDARGRRKEDAEEVAKGGQTLERGLARMGQEVVQERLEAYTREVDADIVVAERLLEDGGDGDTEDGKRQDDEERVAGLGKGGAPCQTE